MEITVTSHNNIITSYRCMEDNGPGPLGFSPVVELTKMWLFVCPFLSLALSLFSPLPFLSPLLHPKNYRCCCPSPNLHIFIIFFFLFLFSLSASSFFFFFFSAPPFFLIFSLLISSSALRRISTALLYPPKLCLRSFAVSLGGLNPLSLSLRTSTDWIFSVE